MKAAPVTIRGALAADAAAIAELAARSFVDAYAADNAAEDVELHVTRTFGAALQGAEIATPGQVYLLAFCAATLVGYAFLRNGSQRDGIAARAPCEVRRFYVDQAWHGRGVAAALMDAAVAHARAAGADVVWLTAWERNPRAQRFYAKCGFADVGEATFLLGRSPQSDRLLLKRLDSA